MARGTAKSLRDDQRADWRLIIEAPFYRDAGRRFISGSARHLLFQSNGFLVIVTRYDGNSDIVESRRFRRRKEAAGKLPVDRLCRLLHAGPATRHLRAFDEDANFVRGIWPAGATELLAIKLDHPPYGYVGSILIFSDEPLHPERLAASIRLLAPRLASEIRVRVLEERDARAGAKLSIFDGLPFEYWLIDRRRQIIAQNRLSVLRRGDLVGQRGDRLAAAGDRDGWVQRLDTALAGQAVSQEIEVRSKGGVAHFIEMVMPLRLENRAEGALGVTFDVTDRKLREQERARQAEWDAQSGKMAALGKLAGGIAHDFNNILGAIMGNTQFLLQDLDEEPLRVFAKRVLSAGERGREIINKILIFSRRTPPVAACLDIAVLVEEAADMVRVATLSEAVEFQVRSAPDRLMVWGDASQLTRMILNLGVNARDALLGRQGRIVIETRPWDRETYPIGDRRSRLRGKSTGLKSWTNDDGEFWAIVGEIPEGDHVSVRVVDTGNGVSMEARRFLFEPFFTTKEKGDGTGYGLSLVRNIVADHGGTIIVRSRLMEGTSFEVLLPRLPVDQPAAPGPAPALPLPLPRGVLVVDDDIDFCIMLESAVERLGYRAAGRTHPLEGLATLLENPDAWGMLITDQLMPDMPGSELIRRAKIARPDLVCILCSGNGGAVNESQALALGADAYLAKPLNIDDLERRIFDLMQLGGEA